MLRYAITDRSLLPPHSGGMEDALALKVGAWVASGLDWVQLREKDLPAETLLSLAQRLVRMTSCSRTRLVVNGLPPEHIAGLNTAGVHLTGGWTGASLQRALHHVPWVTVSCHCLGEVEAARHGNATAILWAPIFGKVVASQKVVAGTGLAALQEACERAGDTPVFALGGVTEANAAQCLAAGAAGIAGIRLFHA